MTALEKPHIEFFLATGLERLSISFEHSEAIVSFVNVIFISLVVD